MFNSRNEEDKVPEASDQKPEMESSEAETKSSEYPVARLASEVSMSKLGKKAKKNIKEAKVESPEFVANTTKSKDQLRSSLNQQLYDIGLLSPEDQKMTDDFGQIFQLVRSNENQAVDERYLKLILGLLGIRSQFASLAEAEKNPTFKIMQRFILSDLTASRKTFQNSNEDRLKKISNYEDQIKEIRSKERDYSDENKLQNEITKEIQALDENIRSTSADQAASYFPRKELKKTLFSKERITWLDAVNHYLTQSDLFQLPVAQSTSSAQSDADQNQWFKNLNESIQKKRTELQAALLSGSDLNLVKQLMSEIKHLVLIEKPKWEKVLDAYLTQSDLFQLPIAQSTSSNQPDTEQNQWLKKLNESIQKKRTELQAALLSGSDLNLVKQLMSEIKHLVLIEKPRWEAALDDYMKNIHPFNPDFKLDLKTNEDQAQANEFFNYLNASIKDKQLKLQTELSLGKDLYQVKQLMSEIRKLISVQAHGINQIQKYLAYFSEKEKQFSGMIELLEAEQKYLSNKIKINPSEGEKLYELQKRISSGVEVYKKNLTRIQLKKNEILSDLILCDSGFLRIRVGINTKLKPLLSGHDDTTSPLKAAIRIQIDRFVANEKIKDGVEILDGITATYKNGISKLDPYIKKTLGILGIESFDQQINLIQSLEEKKAELEKQKPTQVKTIQELEKQKAELEKQDPVQVKEIQALIDLLIQVNKLQLEIDHLKKELIKALEKQNFGNQKKEQSEKIQYLIELLTIEKLFKEEFPLYNQALKDIRSLEVKPFILTDDNKEPSVAIKGLGKDLAAIKKLHEEDAQVVQKSNRGFAAISNSPNTVSSPVRKMGLANSPQVKSPARGATSQSKSSSPIVSVSPEEAAEAERKLKDIQEQHAKLRADQETKVFQENKNKIIQAGSGKLALLLESISEFKSCFSDNLQSFSDVSKQIKTFDESWSSLCKEWAGYRDFFDPLFDAGRREFLSGLKRLQDKIDALFTQVDEKKNQYSAQIEIFKTVSTEYSNTLESFSQGIASVKRISNAILVGHLKKETQEKQDSGMDLNVSKQTPALMNQTNKLDLEMQFEKQNKQLANHLATFQQEVQLVGQETLSAYVSRIQNKTVALNQAIATLNETENRLNAQLLSPLRHGANNTNVLESVEDSVTHAVDKQAQLFDLSENLLFEGGGHFSDEESDSELTEETSPSDQSDQESAQVTSVEFPPHSEEMKTSEALEIYPETQVSFQERSVLTKDKLDEQHAKLSSLLEQHETQVNKYQALKSKTQLYRQAHETDQLNFQFKTEDADQVNAILSALAKSEKLVEFSIEKQMESILSLEESLSLDKINLETYLKDKEKDFSAEYTQAKIQLISDVSQKQIEQKQLIEAIRELIQREMKAYSEFSGIMKVSNQSLATLDAMQTESDQFFVEQQQTIQALTFKEGGNLLAARSGFEKKHQENNIRLFLFQQQIGLYYKNLFSVEFESIQKKVQRVSNQIETLKQANQDNLSKVKSKEIQTQIKSTERKEALHQDALVKCKALEYANVSNFTTLSQLGEEIQKDIDRSRAGRLFLSSDDRKAIETNHSIVKNSQAALKSISNMTEISWNSVEKFDELKSKLESLGLTIPADFGCFISQSDMSVLKNEMAEYKKEIDALITVFLDVSKDEGRSELEVINDFDLALSKLRNQYQEKLKFAVDVNRQNAKLKLIVEGITEDIANNIPVNKFIEKMQSYGFKFTARKHDDHFYLPQSEFSKIKACFLNINLAKDASLILEDLKKAQETMKQVIDTYASGLAKNSSAILASVNQSNSQKMDGLLGKLKALMSDANWETQIYALDDGRRMKLGGVEVTSNDGTKFRAPKTIAAIKGALDAPSKSNVQMTDDEKIKILLEVGLLAKKASKFDSNKFGFFGVQVRTEITHQILKDLGSKLSKENLEAMLGLNPNAIGFDPVKNADQFNKALGYLDKCRNAINSSPVNDGKFATNKK